MEIARWECGDVRAGCRGLSTDSRFAPSTRSFSCFLDVTTHPPESRPPNTQGQEQIDKPLRPEIAEEKNNRSRERRIDSEREFRSLTPRIWRLIHPKERKAGKNEERREKRVTTWDGRVALEQWAQHDQCRCGWAYFMAEVGWIPFYHDMMYRWPGHEIWLKIVRNCSFSK